MRIRDGDSSDPGWKKVGSGIGINIPDPPHWLPIKKESWTIEAKGNGRTRT